MANGLLGLLLALAFVGNPSQERSTSEITFCNFDLPREIKMANANFIVTYSFELDENGRPAKITKVRDDYVGEKAVTSCLENWRFHGMAKGAHMAVIFQWQHGRGWTEMSVTEPDFSQIIKVAGERCPYLRMQAENSNKSKRRKAVARK